MLRVQVRGLLVLQLEPVRARARARVQARGPVLGPRHHHNLWRRWRGSKKRFASIHRQCFSRHRRQSCANC